MCQNVLIARKKLKGRSIYIQKDFTAQEQHIRFKLRQISKIIRDKNSSIKVRLGDLTIFIDDRKFTWNNNKIIAFSGSNVEFLKNIFSQCNINNEIELNLKSNVTHSE